MDRRVALGAVVVVVVAATVWIALPAGRDGRPGTSEEIGAAGAGMSPAAAVAGAGAGRGEEMGGGGDERGGGPAATGARGDRAAGLPAATSPRGTRPAGGGGAAGDAAGEAPAGEAPGRKKRELWEGPHELRGRLLDVEGKPIARARVRLHDAWPWPGAPERPIVETDGEGRFAFAGLPSNRYQVFADAGGGETNVAWHLLPGQDAIDLTLKPEAAKPTPPAGATVVRVVGPDGTPVPRAQLRIVKGRRMAGYGEVKDGTFLRETTGGEITAYGVFDARGADGRTLPYGPLLWTPKAGDEDVVVLPAGMWIAGVVRGPDGTGVFGAEVEARVQRTQDVDGRATTDRDGRFRLGNLGEGPYILRAVPLPPHLPSELVKTTVAVEDVELRVVPGLEADVGVLDADGRPVAGAVVSAMPLGGGSDVKSPFGGRASSEQVTDAAGTAHLAQMVPGFGFTLTASPPSGRRDVGTYSEKDWRPKDATVRLPRAWTIRGVVRRADGATAMSFVHRRVPDGRWLRTPTKKDGAFELTLTDPAPWSLAASPSYDTPRGPEVTITDPAQPVALEAPAVPAK